MPKADTREQTCCLNKIIASGNRGFLHIYGDLLYKNNESLIPESKMNNNGLLTLCTTCIIHNI